MQYLSISSLELTTGKNGNVLAAIKNELELSNRTEKQV